MSNQPSRSTSMNPWPIVVLLGVIAWHSGCASSAPPRDSAKGVEVGDERTPELTAEPNEPEVIAQPQVTPEQGASDRITDTRIYDLSDTTAQPPDEGSAPLTVVIDPAISSGAPSLIEASRAAKERRQTEPIAVITNDNLAEYASQGRLTIVNPDSSPVASSGEEPSPGEGSTDEEAVKGEAYWREGARELRLLWKRSHDAVEELEERAEALRLDFYTEENTFVRDTQIKPTWDRVLDRLEEAKADSVRYREELELFLLEGRRAGALPGWLREGIELEPPATDPRLNRDLESLEAAEPVVVNEGNPNG